MDWIEVTAKTVEDAKELALDRLGVVEDELEFEVLDEPRSGLFRRSDARIRARVKPLSREKPVDRRRRRRGSDRAGRPPGGGSRRASTAVAEDDEATESPSGNGDHGSAPAAPSRSRSRSRGRRGGRGRSGAKGAGTGANGESDTTGARPANRDRDDEKLEVSMDVDTMPVAEQADHAGEFARELVRKMGFAATVATDFAEDDVNVRIEGDHLGVLVGPKGVTLQAIEEVVRAAVQRYAGGHAARVHVDVGGYRERRREALVAFTTKIAGEVKESGSPRALEPMSSSDRKVVHDTVAELDGVSTISEGEDPRRRVVIQPE
jgi:spoIIIJ-associated protein